MRYILTLSIGFLATFNVSGQDRKIIEQLIILEAEHNGEDFSEYYRAKNARFVFYEENGDTFLVNAQDGSASFGEVHLIGHEHHEKTKESPSFAVYRFLWGYANTYDDRKGYCLIRFQEIYQEPVSTFEMMVVTDNFDVSIYKGYEDDI